MHNIRKIIALELGRGHMWTHKVALAVQFVQNREIRLSALAKTVQSVFLSASVDFIAALITLAKLLHGCDTSLLSAKPLILSEC
jgi:hypothetical protein